MRKSAFLFAAAAVVVIGCGGSSGGGDSTGTTGITGTTTRSQAASVSLSSDSRVEFGYLTGQGRAVGDLYMNVIFPYLEDGQGRVLRDSTTPLLLKLTGFQYQTARLPITGDLINGSSRLFDTYTLNPDSFSTEDSAGLVSGSLTPDPLTLPHTFPARIRAFPGRESVVPIRLDDSMFTSDGSTVTLNQDNFEAVNLLSTGDPQTELKIASILSDYIRFDLSAMDESERPSFIGGSAASYVFFSGDNYALGTAFTGLSGQFQEFGADLSAAVDGFYGKLPSSQGQSFPGTYDLRTGDPSDLLGNAKIIAIQGKWRNYNDSDVLTNLHGTEFIIFPNSDDQADTNHPADVALIKRNGSGQITSMYFGKADLLQQKFTVYPIAAISTGDTSVSYTGSFTDLRGSTGGTTNVESLVRYGAFSFDSAPSGFANSGTFIVFRK